MVGLLGCEHTLVAHVKLFIHQCPQVLGDGYHGTERLGKLEDKFECGVRSEQLHKHIEDHLASYHSSRKKFGSPNGQFFLTPVQCLAAIKKKK